MSFQMVIHGRTNRAGRKNRRRWKFSFVGWVVILTWRNWKTSKRWSMGREVRRLRSLEGGRCRLRFRRNNRRSEDVAGKGFSG